MSRSFISTCLAAPNTVRSNTETMGFAFWWSPRVETMDAKRMNMVKQVPHSILSPSSRFVSEDAAIKKPMMMELDAISRYEAGWDGYDAASIDKVVIERLREFVKKVPARLLKHWVIAPSVNGSVSLVSKRRLVVSMSIGNNGFSFVAKAPGKDTIKGNSSYDFNIFNSVFSEITIRFLID